MLVLLALSFGGSAIGFLVELVVAWRYGASAELDAARVSYTALVSGAQLLVTQLLPHFTIPVFLELRAQRGESEAWSAMYTLQVALAAVSAVMLGGVLAGHAGLTRWIAPGLAAVGVAVMPDFLFLLGLSAALMLLAGAIGGVLGVFGEFRVAVLPQILANSCTFVTVLAFPATRPVAALAGGILAGSVIAYGIHAAAAWKFAPAGRPAREWMRFQPSLLVGRRFFSGILIPMSICVAVVHLCSLMVQRALSEQPAGTIALYTYGLRLTTATYTPALILGTVAFPRIAEALAVGAIDQFRAGVWSVLGRTYGIAAAGSAVLWFVRRPLVFLLFGHGRLTPAELETMAEMFGWLLFSTPAAAATSFLWRAFAATRDRTALVAPSVIGLAVLMAAIPLLSAKWGAMGIPMAFSIYINAAAAVQLGILVSRNRQPCRGD